MLLAHLLEGCWADDILRKLRETPRGLN